MQNIKIIKIALIPAVAFIFALSPFSKAHADLIGSQWTIPYYTPTETGLSGPVVPEGNYTNDDSLLGVFLYLLFYFMLVKHLGL